MHVTYFMDAGENYIDFAWYCAGAGGPCAAFALILPRTLPRRCCERRGAVLKQTNATISVSWLFHGIWLEAFSKGRELSPDIRILGIPLGKFLKRNQKKKAKAGFEKAAAEIEDIKEPAVKEPEKEETYRTSAEELEKRRAVKRKTPGSFLTGVLPLEEKDRDFSKVME